MPVRTCSSVEASSSSQSVFGFEMVEVRFLLMFFSLPRRDDATCLVVEIGIYHRNRPTFDQPDGIPPFFRVVETVIETFESRPIKYPNSVLKSDFVDAKVLRAALSSSQVYRISCINITYLRCGPGTTAKVFADLKPT